MSQPDNHCCSCGGRGVLRSREGFQTVLSVTIGLLSRISGNVKKLK